MSERKDLPQTWIIVTVEGAETTRKAVGRERAVEFCKEHNLPLPANLQTQPKP